MSNNSKLSNLYRTDYKKSSCTNRFGLCKFVFCMYHALFSMKHYIILIHMMNFTNKIWFMQVDLQEPNLAHANMSLHK